MGQNRNCHRWWRLRDGALLRGGLLDDGEEDKDEQITDLNYQVEMLRGLKEQMLIFEIEFERRLNNIEIKKCRNCR